ncbi:MAG: hypothetical protein R3E83_06640 [Burkholderiaceae bacterium]
MRDRGLEIDQRGVGDGDDPGERVDGEAPTGVVIEAVGDEIGGEVGLEAEAVMPTVLPLGEPSAMALAEPSVSVTGETASSLTLETETDVLGIQPAMPSSAATVRR